MSDKTKIEWTDATANYMNGCSLVSPGCTSCYAQRLAGTRLKNHPTRIGLTVPSKNGPVWNGEVRANEGVLDQVMGWKRPRKIFWNAHGDIFHPAVTDEQIDRMMAVCAMTPQHIHQILTKRAARMRDYMRGGWHARVSAMVNEWPWPIRSGNEFTADMRLMTGLPLPNVWLGVSIEDRTRMLERAPLLADTPAAIRFWSAEPLLGDLGQIYPAHMPDWFIIGGESGPGARPLHPDWVGKILHQAEGFRRARFFKQWGDWQPFAAPSVGVSKLFMHGKPYGPSDIHRFKDGMHCVRVGKKLAGAMYCGQTYREMP